MKSKKGSNIYTLNKKKPKCVHLNPYYKYISDKKSIINKTIATAKYLSQEILVTKLLINRLQRNSKRQVIVIAIERTGIAYTWGIKENKNIKVDSVYFGSTPISVAGIDSYISWKNNLLEKMAKYNQKYKKPLIIFIDSSSHNLMPGSLVGNFTSHTPEESINGILKNKGYNTKILGYNISKGITNIPMGPENIVPKDFLPNWTKNKSELDNTDVILFNPSKRRDISINIKGSKEKIPWKRAPHSDDYFYQSDQFKKYVLKLMTEKEEKIKSMMSKK